MGLFPRRFHAMVGVGSIVFGLAGCESPSDPVVCTTIAVQAITLTVVDGTSGQRICDATVTAVDGSFSQGLPPFPGSAPTVLIRAPPNARERTRFA